MTSQRVQIVLFRLQSQTALLAGAQQRLDAVRTRMGEAVTHHKQVAGRIQSIEEGLRTETDAAKKKEFEVVLPHMKADLESIVAEEGQRRSFEADAESQVRAEQAKLADLQSLLDRLDKALDALSKPK